MHGPNSGDNTPEAKSRAPAPVASVGHKNIFREASVALSQSDEKRKNILKIPQIGKYEESGKQKRAHAGFDCKVKRPAVNLERQVWIFCTAD